MKATLPCALLLVAACSGAFPDEGEDAFPREDTRSVPEAPQVPFQRVATPLPADWARQERGSGVVFPSSRPFYTGRGADTVVVQAEPSPMAPALARLRLEVDSLTWEYVLEARTEVAEGGAVEFGYEEIGLPVVEVRRVAGQFEWLRVYYGLGQAGEPLFGWVRLEPPRVEFLSWSERLPDLPLFFLDADSIRFHTGVEGAIAPVELSPGQGPGFDYILYPLETRGQWMRVEVVTPSDYCADPEEPRHDTTWIRHLTADERPSVWYHTRGC